MSFGSRLRQERERLRLTQEKFAELGGVKRVSQHRASEGSQFAAKYNCKRLAWYEIHEDINVAIQREKSIKRYSRAWKINLIEAMNPDWMDLWEEIRPQPLPGERRTIDELRRGDVE